MRGVAITSRGAALVLAALALALGPSLTAEAQNPVGLDMFSVPETFQVTLKSCQISSDGGSTFIDLFTADQAMDVASVNAGQTVTDFVSDLTLPAATYDLIRCIVSGTAIINGSIEDTGTSTTYYTDPTVAQTQTGTDPDAQADITVDAGADQTVDLAINLTVQAGNNRQVRIDFDLSEAIELFDVGGGGRMILPNADGFDVSITILS